MFCSEKDKDKDKDKKNKEKDKEKVEKIEKIEKIEKAKRKISFAAGVNEEEALTHAKKRVKVEVDVPSEQIPENEDTKKKICVANENEMKPILESADEQGIDSVDEQGTDSMPIENGSVT